MAFLFQSEQAPVSRVIFDKTSPSPPFNTPVDGEMWYDATQKQLKVSVNGVTYAAGSGVANINVTPVSASFASSTAAQNLATFSFPAGSLNVVGKTLKIWAAGLYSTGTSTPTVTVSLKLGSVTLASTVSQATTASQTNFPWQFEAYATVVSVGTTATIEAHGLLRILLGSTATAPMSTYTDANTAVSSAVDLTVAETLALSTAMSAAAASNAVSFRQFIVQVSN